MGNTNFSDALLNPDYSRVMICGPITWGVKQGINGKPRGPWGAQSHPDKLRVTTICLLYNGREFAVGSKGGVLAEGMNDVWSMVLPVVDRDLAMEAAGKTIEATGIIEYPGFEGLPQEGAWNECVTLSGCS